MTFRIFFFLAIITLTSNSYSQWWVSGGNVIWPHGNVNISKGNLFISNGNLTVGGDTMNIASKFFLPDYSFDIYNYDLFPIFQITPQRKTTLGDINDVYYNTKFFVDDNNVTIGANSYIYNNQSLLTRIGDYEGNNNGTYIYIEDDGDAKINLNADSVNVLFDLNVGGNVKYSGIPSDSTAASSGQLWYNSSTGALHRKF